MTIVAGNIVMHLGALTWGSGKVVEVTPAMATIEFSDGISRKIAASHFGILQPADKASYSPPPQAEAEPAKPRRASRAVAKKK